MKITNKVVLELEDKDFFNPERSTNVRGRRINIILINKADAPKWDKDMELKSMVLPNLNRGGMILFL
jgi:hypothetical protein